MDSRQIRFFNICNRLSENQFSFREGEGTSGAILNYISNVYDNIFMYNGKTLGFISRY